MLSRTRSDAVLGKCYTIRYNIGLSEMQAGKDAYRIGDCRVYHYQTVCHVADFRPHLTSTASSSRLFYSLLAA